MYFVKKDKLGKVIEGPKPLSGDPTASPNIYWQKEQLDIHGFELLDIENQKVEAGNILPISESEKTAARDAKVNAENSAKAERRRIKQNFATKFKLDPTDIAGFRAIIEDGNLS